jgi:hypothetical protein
VNVTDRPLFPGNIFTREIAAYLETYPKVDFRD